MNMQSLLDELNALVAKLELGTASLGEIEAFAAATAELHERAIILRYKVYESSVFGENRMEEAPNELGEHISEIVQPEPEEPIEIALEPEPELDDSSNMEFDLFSMDEPETPLFSAPEPVAIEVPVPIEEAPIQHELTETPFVEPVAAPVIEQITRVEPETTLPHTTHEQFEVGVEIHSIYRRLDPNDDSLAARLMKVRVDTLHGIFGFNERNEIIHELFGGNSETYSAAIEQLDRLATAHEARLLVSQFATRFGWDEESDLALDFIQKVERRYA